ncbi:hypothetical protein C9374_005232 [Naegleria lovaniensis]|uniref:Peptidase M50B-like protein n=1 Tax=Naegleria lovaniensis TaxID=51637 RepID=A0AA88KIW5_NAELO|nr:uncharacterized protein C9374_005232 [Naegleria lovaniensis]KAG2382652.1 hypothetical protein C9374_005232 [Naegleria lovaniensis]
MENMNHHHDLENNMMEKEIDDRDQADLENQQLNSLASMDEEQSNLEFYESSFSIFTPLKGDEPNSNHRNTSSSSFTQSSTRTIQSFISSLFSHSITWLIMVSILTILLWQLPSDVGNYIIYPFTIFGTFWHELGHATTALVCGNTIEFIKIESNGSGLTVYQDMSQSMFCNALISVNGPLGPTFFGCLIICLSVAFVKHELFSRVLISTIATIVLLVTILFIRKSIFGMIFLPIVSLVLYGIAIKAPKPFVTFSLQFIGVQMAISMYENLMYLFSKMNGKSDTGSVEVLFRGVIPYWLVAIFIIVINIACISLSLWFVIRHSLSNAVAKKPEANERSGTIQQ